MKTMKQGFVVISVVGAALLLGACADGYSSGYSDVSVGMRSYDGYGYRANARDIDGDGIANRYDRDRDGDGIRNRNDRDRDGDGVPNRFDGRPNNPYID